MTTSVISVPKPNMLRMIAAWGVHLFTATGAIWGLLGIFAVFEGDYKMMIVWMIVAMLVDGFDGTLARWANVKKYASGLDGALLDNILDYLNYVLVPAIFMIHTDLLPESVKWLTASLILLSSAYQFTQTDAKTDDHHFKGFPSYWNVAALYMLLMNLPPWVNFGFLMLFNIMVFIPVKYIYPSRNNYLRTLTLVLTYLYGVIGVWGLLQYPNQPNWVAWASLIYVAYYLVLSLIPKHNKTAHAN
ncbi:MAG: CDP-alcohol phosphatidyltransferase family protein [Chloroflexi bacterium]|nr:CDP-alcohol phosphatidyltransferase family protein [Chloroflexota bacterium]MBI3168719.1 CDP-alcohol phosphatidyltransferase family protein [Chloroflexota bacterium]